MFKKYHEFILKQLNKFYSNPLFNFTSVLGSCDRLHQVFSTGNKEVKMGHYMGIILTVLDIISLEKN